VYLSNQAAHLLPHGGYDSDTLNGNIQLRISPGGEPFVALGGANEVTDASEIIYPFIISLYSLFDFFSYSDEKQVLTRRWNSRDCEVTKITASTRNFLLFVELPSDKIPIGMFYLSFLYCFVLSLTCYIFLKN
jgi:DNA/RNA-binding domain of Phe-tRNA-synthetase-like protein